MRIFISVDMDGVTGVTHPDQMFEGGHDYRRACVQLTADINAAITGALMEEPASEFVVSDGHAQGRNVIIEELHEAAALVAGPMHERNRPLSQAQGMEGCELAFFVGYHAKSGTPGGLLAHTWAGPVIADVRLNGLSVGETGINAAVAGHWGIPLGMVSGAHDLQPEVDALAANTVLCVTKQGYGKTAALCLPPAKTRALLKEGSAEAVRRFKAGELKPFRPGSPTTMEVDCHKREQAELACEVAGTERAAERTIRVIADNPLQAALTMWKAMCRAQDTPPSWLK